MTEPARQPTPNRAASQSSSLLQVGILVLAFVGIANAAFFFLSGLYFDDKRANLLAAPITDEHVRGVRIAFAMFTAVVGLAIVGVAAKPRWLAHGIASAIGVGSMFAAFTAFDKELPIALPIALLLIGALMPVLAWASLKRIRPAWAFLAALCVVYAIVLFFGATKVRTQLGVSLWTSLTLPGLLAVATAGFALIRRDYRET